MQRHSLLFAAAAAWTLLPISAPAAAAPRSVTIVIDKMKFAAPGEIHKGDIVVWDNRDMFRHSATSKGAFDVDLPPGKAVKMRVTADGSFAFTCKYHPGMKGVLKVVK